MPEPSTTPSQQVHSQSEFLTGWPVVLSAGLGVGLGLTGMVFYTLGLFFIPLSQEFGWQRTDLSIVPLVLTGTLIVMSPIVGKVSDKFGVRVVGLIGLLGLSIGLLNLSAAGQSLSNYYISWMLVSVLGAGTIPVVWTRAVNATFKKRRGLALGMTLCGTGLAAASVPPFLSGIIEDHGWRAGFQTMAGLIFFIGIPVVFLLFRKGTEHDVIHSEGDSNQENPSLLEGLSLRAASRTRHFWLTALGFLLLSTTISALIVHLPAILVDTGLSGQQAGGVVGLMGIFVLIGRLCVGFLVDRYEPPVIAFISLCLPILSCVLLASGAPQFVTLQLAVILLGLSAGAEVDLLAFLTNRSFGLRSYGSIYGIFLSFFSLGAGLGPLLLGLGYENYGSYGPMLLVLAACTFIGAACVLALKLPNTVSVSERFSA